MAIRLSDLYQVGTYLFKFIVDDNWTYSPDSCLTKPDEAGNINNYINVSFLVFSIHLCK